MTIRHISAVTLFVADMARACAFYEALGFARKFGGAHTAFTSLHAGTSFVNLNAGPPPSPDGGLTIFHVDDVDAAHRRAVTAGLRPDFAPENAPWGERYFHIRDPDGYLLSFATPLSEYRELDRSPANRAGVDGCPGGWVAVTRNSVRLDTHLATLLADLQAETVAVDMPIGLADHSRRACDRAARRLLGRARSSSVFTPPVRAALGAASHGQASDRNAAACGRRLSVQTFNILGKIGEVDTLLCNSARWRGRIFEAHPEVSFAAMNTGIAIAEPKGRPAGRAKRQQLIAELFGRDIFANARALVAKKHAADDDIADAFACLFTAERIAAGEHVSLPDIPEIDAQGLPMRIVY